MPEVAPFDPERLVRVLAGHNVLYVLIGALAARLQGFPRLTADADITPATDPKNLVRLAAALRELEARVFTAGVPEGLRFDCSARTLANAEIWNLVTTAGRVDIDSFPGIDAGPEKERRGYDRLPFGEGREWVGRYSSRGSKI